MDTATACGKTSVNTPSDHTNVHTQEHIPANLCELLKELARYNDFGSIVGHLQDIGLEARFESRKDHPESTRILITHDKFSTRFNSELYFQANGAVYDVAEKRFVCVPSSAFNYKPKFEEIVKNLNSYKIYRVHDGTIVNLYWYDNKWCLGSANGYETNMYRWIGPNTYWEEFTGVLKMYPNWSFDNLNKNYTYTIGFRCENFHPLRTDKPHCWVVAIHDNQTLNPAFHDVGLPFQEEIRLDAIPGETLRDKFYSLISENHDAYYNYLKDRSRHNYGIILRGEFAVHNMHANIMIESTLMAKVRKLMYNFPKMHRSRIVLNNTNRLEYNTLKAYLTYASRSDFVQLFPELKPRFDVYNKIIADVTERMIRGYRNRNLRNKLVGAKPGTKLTLDSLAITFMTNLDRCEKINPMSPHCRQIIYNYIVDPRYLDMYFTMLTT